MQMSVSMSECKRCGKEFAGPACPYCTVTGVDLEALLNAEEMRLLRDEDEDAAVALVDMVSGKALAVATPLCKIGRDLGNDIPLAGDRSMSRFHFQIRQTSPNDYYIEDCGSRNGTFLNGSPIAIPRKLQNGDIVSAGISRYRFAIQTEGAQSEETLHAQQATISPPTHIMQAAASGSPGEALQKLKGTLESAAEGDETKPAEVVYSMAPPPQNQTQATQAARVEDSKPRKPIDQSSPPAWLDEYLFPEVQKLMSEKERLNGLVEEIRQDIKQIDRKIVSAQSISQALLSSSGHEVGQASKQVFDVLDWFAELAPNNQFEMNLKTAPKIDAVVRVVLSQADPTPKDFEALVNQQAVVWCQSNYEPKGIMIVQVSPELPPPQRTQLSRDFLESMRRKKICVVLPTQLLAIYRLVVLSGHDKGYFKDLFLQTCGPLPGFMMKPQDNHAATA